MPETTTRSLILLVDDEPTFLAATADLLRGEGYEVLTAADAPAARVVLQAHRPDLIISDIRMAGNDDLSLLRDVREANDPPPVIVVTGYPSVETALPAIDIGVSAYLTKPLRMDAFLRAVRVATEQRAASRALALLVTRARAWEHDMRLVQDVAAAGDARRSPAALSNFASMTLNNIARSIEDLRRVVDAASGRPPLEAHACLALNCPRYALLDGAIVDAIDVLEETRNAFKSRQLGDLRRRLEEVRGAAGDSRSG